MIGSHDTLSLTDAEEANGDTPVGEHPGLIRLLEFDHPIEGSSCHALSGVEQCVIGRSESRLVCRDGATLRINVIDPRVSARHACLRRSTERWIVEDSGSKNGIEVNWIKTRSATLENNDLVLLGNTLFLFTDNLPKNDDADLKDSELPCLLPGLMSLNHRFAALLESIAKIAVTNLELLISGETGTGKELVARAVHELSQRKGEFVAVNCGAIPPNMIEGQMFGWRRGAFSGAVNDRPGLIRSAEGGTLFLDEIGDLPLAPQAALLRALQEGAVVPIGDSQPIEVNFRLVAASHRDLRKMVDKGLFREDLLARIRGFAAKLPALRERKEDLGLLIATLLARILPKASAKPRFTAMAARKLIAYDWPRNVRELDKCLAAAVALADGDSIDVDHLPSEVRAGVPNDSLSKKLRDPRREDDESQREEEIERKLLIDLLRQHKGNLAAVARGMGTSRSQVHRLLKRFRLDPADYRGC